MILYLNEENMIRSQICSSGNYNSIDNGRKNRLQEKGGIKPTFLGHICKKFPKEKFVGKAYAEENRKKIVSFDPSHCQL